MLLLDKYKYYTREEYFEITFFKSQGLTDDFLPCQTSFTRVA